MNRVFDGLGRAVTFVSEGRAGGEGTVYRIAGSPGRCAKIYHPERRTAERAAKLRAMIESPPVDPTMARLGHRSLAWPLGLLQADPTHRQRDPIGFEMPFVDTTVLRSAHTYYDPEDRLARFRGSFTWAHLLATAENLATAVAALHAAGHRVGDLRETNLLVSPTALVTLLDCDSMQIREASGRFLYCRVGTGEYLPPELHGVDFGVVDVDREHGDRFALAVLVFKLLMNGTHPFQARGALAAETPTTEEKIRKGYYPYAAGSPFGDAIAPPRHALPFEIVPPALAELFERCFAAGHHDPDARPTPRCWADALAREREALVGCGDNENHCYHATLVACPWCRVLAETSRDHFPKPAPRVARAEDPPARRAAYLRELVATALLDGVLAPAERALLERMGADLGIPRREIAQAIADEAERRGIRLPP
jgi:DNA-binding helix-hairpin-helix protein with protein kinase domain